ncbi:hypothetical protein XELAEV_18001425mg [Xenopus laevis]|nr:hypothetical protein XELAEV_18001425mg [Xenopus laevis]
MSAQEAELQALITAFTLAEGQRANIFSDSRYCIGICLDYLLIWRARNFMTSSVLPIANYQLPVSLFRTLIHHHTDTIAAYRKHTDKLYDTVVNTIATKKQITG